MSDEHRIGILGSGDVARGLGTALLRAGCQVMLGARTANKDALLSWAEENGIDARAGTFAEAAEFGTELVLNCTAGAHSLTALADLGDALRGKTLLDVANPLDFSQGMPPRPTIPGGDSLGEQIQRALPETQVVKGLNTVASAVMVNPSAIPELHHLFLCGNDAAAKARVCAFLRQRLGWQETSFLDLGDITAARTTEAYAPLLLQLFATLQTPLTSIRVVHG
ncbi:MAG: NAD(P)-binding domain-containing protein [Pseudomonadales bacterium]|jgi:predicted dinucleotide-binding enzyme|nr:NAD(P)-binding domain-containing protein [Pseudomonadales bacterium]